MTTDDEQLIEQARKVLGVDAGDSAQTVRSAFRKRSMETHPDRQGSAEAFEEVRRSYELLAAHAAQSDNEGTADWVVGDDDVDVRVVDEEPPPRRRRFEEMFLEALRRENGE